MAPVVGKAAPAFQAVDQNGKKHSLKEFKGSWLLLYFYPKDDTPGCTEEACVLRDEFAQYRKRGVAVVGVSTDDVKSHAAFASTYALPFPLLADTDRTIVNAYGVWREKSMYGRTYMGIARTSFLIDQKGMIVKIYESVKPEDHAQEVLADFDTMQ